MFETTVNMSVINDLFKNNLQGKSIGAKLRARSIFRRTTSVCNLLTLPQIVKCFVHTPINNALRELGSLRPEQMDPTSQLAQTASDILNYVTTCLTNNEEFSTIIENAPESLGYYIHADSFLLALKGYVRYARQQEGDVNCFSGLFKADDIDFLNMEELLDNRKVIATKNSTKVYNDVISIHELSVEEQLILGDNTNSSGPSPSPSLPSSSASSPELVPPSSPAPELVPTSSSASSSASYSSSYSLKDSSGSLDSSSSSMYDYEDKNSAIIVCTIVVFIAIKVLAWYVKEYHKDTMKELSAEVVSENSLEENVLCSVYEPFTPTIMLKLVGLLFPTWVFFYSLRTYYYHRLVIRFKKRKRRSSDIKESGFQSIS